MLHSIRVRFLIFKVQYFERVLLLLFKLPAALCYVSLSAAAVEASQITS